MQPTFSSSRILLPAKSWFIALSLLVALLCNMLPLLSWPGMPDWLALVLCFWSVRESRRIGMGWGFLFGLVMDVADGSLMGQHALAYVLLTYVALTLARRILWFPLLTQALHVLPMLVLVQAIQYLARAATGAPFPGIGFFISPLLGALLWLPLTYLLLLPQYQPVERDDNRPI